MTHRVKTGSIIRPLKVIFPVAAPQSKISTTHRLLFAEISGETL